MGRQGHNPVLRRRVIDLLESGKSVREVAEELGVSGQSSFWIGSPGRLDFNSQRPYSITSRCSTIANDGTQR
jgi:orotate phosphoribosyltransferase-like protein